MSHPQRRNKNRPFQFEHRSEPLLPRRAFLGRLARSVFIVVAIVFGSLALGVLGYHYLEGLPWIDAGLNSAMILVGMGPVHQLNTVGCKLFAICYALFSGIVFLTVVAVLFAPVLHRLLHRFHLELEDQGSNHASKSDAETPAARKPSRKHS